VKGTYWEFAQTKFRDHHPSLILLDAILMSGDVIRFRLIYIINKSGGGDAKSPMEYVFSSSQVHVIVLRAH
jgi:hypothetical protein